MELVCEEMSHVFAKSLAHTLPGLEMQICCQGTMPDALAPWTASLGIDLAWLDVLAVG